MTTPKKAALRIKNYTSEISVEESLGLIRSSLSQHQARRIIYENDESGAIVALSFEIAVAGHRFTFRLPARFAGVREQVARAWESRGRAIRDDALLDEQAQRTAHSVGQSQRLGAGADGLD